MVLDKLFASHSKKPLKMNKQIPISQRNESKFIHCRLRLYSFDMKIVLSTEYCVEYGVKVQSG